MMVTGMNDDESQAQLQIQKKKNRKIALVTAHANKK